MSLERLVQSSSIKIEEIILPEEVWIKIWSYLDFKTAQKICTRVTKSWLKMIRSSKLSWEMKLEHHEFHNVDVLEVETFNGILSHWENLRVIHFSFEREFARFCLSLNSHQSLEKIVILSGPILYVKGSILGRVHKYWINPRNILTPTNSMKNVIMLEIPSLKCLSEEFAMAQNDCDFTNLENLIVSHSLTCQTAIPEPALLLRFKNLKTLQIGNIEIRINYLLDLLRFLGNTMNLKISARSVEVKSHLDAEATKDIFKQAFEIVNEKFPHPDPRILDLHIFEIPSSWMEPRYSIRLNQSANTLTTIDSDSEAETETEMNTSDSMDDSIESSDSLDESVKSSDSMNESVENSNSMDENVNSSDTEDMNA